MRLRLLLVVSCSLFISIFIFSGASLASDFDDGSTTLDAVYRFEIPYMYTDIHILEDGSIDI
ncbi:MAG: hypothetical protein KAS47_05035, partial [Candidatus Heimdallarchaeota archaeon]|nr:hypothetical protein [Candidatus Heimdallarchaeota archaeon]